MERFIKESFSVFWIELQEIPPADQDELKKILEEDPDHGNELKQNLLQVSSDQLPSHEIPVANFSTQIGSKIKELIKTTIESKLGSSSTNKSTNFQSHNKKIQTKIYALIMMIRLVSWFKNQLSLLRMIYFHYELKSTRKLNSFPPMSMAKSQQFFKTSFETSVNH